MHVLFTVNMHVLLGWKWIWHLRSHIDPVISVSDIYAKVSVYEIKIHFECSFDFPSANNGYEW